MAEAALEWGNDFVLDPTGDLLIVSGDDEVRQRLERRLFTAVQGYVWHPDYGAGLPQKIGSPFTVQQIKSIVQSQLNLEASVAPNPPAQLTVTEAPGGFVTIGIQYFDAVTGTAVSFTITS